MSASAIVSIVLATLTLLVRLLNTADAEKLRNEGRAEQINASLANIARMTMSARDAEKQVAAMSDADIIAELRKYSYDDSGSGHGSSK